MTNRPPTIGETAPELRSPTLDGDVFDLRSVRGQPVLVSFLRHAG